MKGLARAGIILSAIVVALGYSLIVINIITMNKAKRLSKMA